MYAGISALNLDTKGRMTLPARYREMLLSQSGGQLALIESDDGCLLLMPHDRWLSKVGSCRQTSLQMSVAASGWVLVIHPRLIQRSSPDQSGSS